MSTHTGNPDHNIYGHNTFATQVPKPHPGGLRREAERERDATVGKRPAAELPAAAPELAEAAGSARQCSASGGESTAARAAVASQQLRDGEAKLGSSATLQRQRRGVGGGTGDSDGGGDQPADSDRGSRYSGGRRLAVRQWLRGADGGQELGSCAARRTAARRGSDGAAKGWIDSDGARARRRDATLWDGGQRSRWWSTRPASSAGRRRSSGGGAAGGAARRRRRSCGADGAVVALSAGRMRDFDEIATTRWRAGRQGPRPKPEVLMVVCRYIPIECTLGLLSGSMDAS
ncbi:hypothetical protein Scep_007172 [Stephania cephalantha]|uniref:Uncharacterized protein n=1 Tax=Stephania cephalantha TaxID=152367 RepID=A0AAP0KAL4_9MAGN